MHLIAAYDGNFPADMNTGSEDGVDEERRLLYVALTRARDRLYLSTTVENGACRMGRGSLGEVLPASVRARFTPSS